MLIVAPVGVAGPSFVWKQLHASESSALSAIDWSAVRIATSGLVDVVVPTSNALLE